jgi:hypothetical protein
LLKILLIRFRAFSGDSDEKERYLEKLKKEKEFLLDELNKAKNHSTEDAKKVN